VVVTQDAPGVLGATFVEDARDTQDGDGLSGAVSGARPMGGMLVRLTTIAVAVGEQQAV